MILPDLLKETIRSGTIASLLMMPAGFLFKYLGLRVGHYGPKLAMALFDSTAPTLLFAQHMVLGWLSALPLLVALKYTNAGERPVSSGAAYGCAYYLAVNSIALPIAFGEATPWELGPGYVLPSLIVHIIFGAAIGYVSGAWVRPRAVNV